MKENKLGQIFVSLFESDKNRVRMFFALLLDSSESIALATKQLHERDNIIFISG